MKGDFSRNTFNPAKHFTSVRIQQGRVQIDADWNEQTDILLHYMQTLAADLIGPYGGPANNCGFIILTAAQLPTVDFPLEVKNRIAALRSPDLDLKQNFIISRGNYYVDGVLCESDNYTIYSSLGKPELAQPEWTVDKLQTNKTYLLYLDVWERLVTALEDDSVREVALGGLDTAVRAKVVWQVKSLDLTGVTEFDSLTCANIDTSQAWLKQLAKWQSPNRGLLKAKAAEAKDAAALNPCNISPEARYRGAENQLYRVEIHKGGTNLATDKPTFKWSRENGSTVYAIRSLSGNQVTLENFGRDSRFGLQIGDWVEIIDDDYALRDKPEQLFEVVGANPIDLRLTLRNPTPGNTEPKRSLNKHPLLRRWDHKQGDTRTGGLTLDDNGAALIVEGTGDRGWLILEDGVQVQFQPTAQQYRAGDYWLIPARTVTGDVEWPGDVGKPEALPPHGVQHHYAPLARVSIDAGGGITILTQYQRKFKNLAVCL